MKQHTIIFVPHARAKFRKWRISTLQAALTLGTLTCLTVGGLITTALYFDSSFDRSQLGQVEAENADLREVNQRFETSVRDLESQLTEYQERIHQLAIVAGLDDVSAVEPGIGGTDPEPANELEGDLLALRGQIEALDSGLDQLGDRLDERRTMLSAMPTLSPAKGIFTSGFGYRSDPFTKKRAFHRGLDIVAPVGNDVIAPGDGIVVKAGRGAGYGNVVYLSHGYGITTRYGHLSKVAVKAGTRVRRGDVIGHVGNTGRSTGTHLHYEVRVDGKALDPLAYIFDQLDG